MAFGLRTFGVADHVHTRSSWLRIEACRKEYSRLEASCKVLFGVEVSVMPATHVGGSAQPPFDFSQLRCRWGDVSLSVAVSDEDISKHRVDYVLGGAHWPLGKCEDGNAVMRCFHRQNMFLLTHPRVDVLAHPWWIYTPTIVGENVRSTPWLLDFAIIPDSMHDEMRAAARRYAKAVEINARALQFGLEQSERFLAQYVDFLLSLKEDGIKLVMGSDSHARGYSRVLEQVLPCIESLCLSNAHTWWPESES